MDNWDWYRCFGFGFGCAVAALAFVSVLPRSASADFLGPPIFSADRPAFTAMASACNGSLNGSTKDETFSISSSAFFYRSATLCEAIDGEEFCATYLVSVAAPHQCLGSFYTTGAPLYGSVARSLPTAATESVLLDAPGGRLQVIDIFGGIQVQFDPDAP